MPDHTTSTPGPIGIFDSGYGGLTVLKAIRTALPQYDYLYLGDNARAPYGTRPFDAIYRYTAQAVRHLFDRGCHLVILACNTASAKALRTIQQHDLIEYDPMRRVLGVIRPTVEALPAYTHNGHIGILATPGTVASQSYDIETAKLYPDYHIYSHAAPIWVPLVEYGQADADGTDFFVQQDIEALLAKCPDIDTILLGCTHYPILIDKIRMAVGDRATIISQGDIVARSLDDYLQRHPEMRQRLTTGGTLRLTTTEDPARFAAMGSIFLGDPGIAVSQVTLE